MSVERVALVGIHHVQLSCPAGDEDPLRRFYGGLLGMTEIRKPPTLAARGGVWFRTGHVELHLGVEADFRPAHKAHPGLLVRGLTELADRLERAGHPVDWDPHLPGYRRCHTSDPSGNRLEFLEPLEPTRSSQ